MKILDLFRKPKEAKQEIKEQPKAERTGRYYPLFTDSEFTGEKNYGEMGPVKNYTPSFDILRARSWQAYAESEIAKTILGRFSIWVIGGGLKLQSEPVSSILEMEGIKLKTEEFNLSVESRFSLWSKSKSCDYSGMVNLNKLENRGFINSIVGGDVLVVLRYEEGLTVQLIDGAHVRSPFGYEFNERLKNGNRIKNGVEISESGKHVAYHVEIGFNEFKRIESKGKTGLTMAYMVYGSEYRLDNHRGMPLIATVLETLKKLERYKEATVGSAEERQKIAFSIEHTRDSNGENPMARNLTRLMNIDAAVDSPVDIDGKALSNQVAATTNKQAINMPIGSTLKMLESKNELYFKDFYTVNIDLVCACVGIPPEVAMSKYDSNFSSARAAIKDWEHSLGVRRKDFSEQFMQPIYDFWLEIEILSNRIQAPGYIQAKLSNDLAILNSYRNARFVGPSVPHIDPLKEVKAEREKLGALGVNLPLTTVEAATEALNGGESYANMLQFADELKDAKDLKIFSIPSEDVSDAGES